jgi:hypothetical protein
MKDKPLPQRTLLPCILANCLWWLLSLMLFLPTSGSGQRQSGFNAQTLLAVFPGGGSMAMLQAQTDREAAVGQGYEKLLAKAKTHGSVRVITRLKLDDWTPEGDLPNAQAVAAQREAIAELQARLLKRISAFAVGEIKLFTSVPQIAMEVDVEGLKDLRSNPDVSGIQEDTLW